MPIILILVVDSSVFILWIPIIFVSLLSIIKLFNRGGPDGKPWIRIEKVEENE
jgi:hypothetical protein